MPSGLLMATMGQVDGYTGLALGVECTLPAAWLEEPNVIVPCPWHYITLRRSVWGIMERPTKINSRRVSSCPLALAILALRPR